MGEAVLYIPLVTTVIAVVFAVTVFRRWRTRPGSLHLAWWSVGLVLYGVGTLTEGLTALFNWHEPVFRTWYISGALLGGAPLAQGTVYLLLPRRTGHILTVPLVTFIVIASIFVLLTPLEPVPAGDNHLNADIIEWTWVRAFSPLVNTYAVIFLIGGAIYSAVIFRHTAPRRAKGTAAIAFGAILPGIGGAFTRAGYTEVLYVCEVIGLSFIFLGYWLTVTPPREHRQVEAAAAAVAGR